ncbi:putative chromatin-remodeling complex ATPase chain isoform X3 [Silene latifolia]|uniref:putative chromatin-remodeling complex ATPase chain isoform X3 n=1 Tax=Silene latifolia TaxID=37657 RepID=UPI003D787785
MEKTIKCKVPTTVDSNEDNNDDDITAAAIDGDEDESNGNEISKREKARLKEWQNQKKQKIQNILDQQNAAVEADMNRGNDQLKYLLQQTKIFAHLVKGDHSKGQKKVKGRF